VEFVVVTDNKTKSTLASVTDFGKFIKKAPVCIAVFTKETKYYLEDGCAAVENILLAATGLQLGACWVAGDKKPFAADINNLLGVPAFFKLIALVPVGYPKHPPSPKSKRDLADVIHWERY
jgi:nitroreductase